MNIGERSLKNIYYRSWNRITISQILNQFDHETQIKFPKRLIV